MSMNVPKTSIIAARSRTNIVQICTVHTSASLTLCATELQNVTLMLPVYREENQTMTVCVKTVMREMVSDRKDALISMNAQLILTTVIRLHFVQIRMAVTFVRAWKDMSLMKQINQLASILMSVLKITLVIQMRPA